MFLDNKYTKLYFKLIASGRSAQGEKHHIIPKSLGGSNNNDNLITVSPKMHFILHKLLCKMVIDPLHLRAMNFALWQMMNRKVCKYTSRDYEKVRNDISNNMKTNNPMFDPNISKLFKKRRPDQSAIASKRNRDYWENKARPLRTFTCPVCENIIVTRIPTKKTCSKSCSAKLQHSEPVLFRGGAHTQ